MGFISNRRKCEYSALVGAANFATFGISVLDSETCTSVTAVEILNLSYFEPLINSLTPAREMK
jgi:hypothetical protein